MSVAGWSGRIDVEDGVLGLRWHQAVNKWSLGASKGFAFLGFCSDEGVRRNKGRVGAKHGPTALRAICSNLPHRHDEILCDAGDILIDGIALETGQSQFAGKVSELISSGQTVLGLGGGHEIAWASWQGLANSGLVLPGQRVGILSLDAHFDMRKSDQPTSGSSFAWILPHAASLGINLEYWAWGISEAANTQALFEYACDQNVGYRTDRELSLNCLSERLQELHDWASTKDHIYLTICLDVLPASVAPGVSAPAAFGVSVEVIEALVESIGKSGKVRIMDVAELNPSLDIDSRTARAASRLIWRFVRSVCEQ
jgi:formiminoglutamase